MFRCSSSAISFAASSRRRPSMSTTRCRLRSISMTSCLMPISRVTALETNTPIWSTATARSKTSQLLRTSNVAARMKRKNTLPSTPMPNWLPWMNKAMKPRSLWPGCSSCRIASVSSRPRTTISPTIPSLAIPKTRKKPLPTSERLWKKPEMRDCVRLELTPMKRRRHQANPSSGKRRPTRVK